MALAERCCTSTAYIGQIEIGNRFPSPDMIEKIAAALEIKPYLLFFDEENETITERHLPKKMAISDSTKAELVKKLTNAINKVIKRIK